VKEGGTRNKEGKRKRMDEHGVVKRGETEIKEKAIGARKP